MKTKSSILLAEPNLPIPVKSKNHKNFLMLYTANVNVSVYFNKQEKKDDHSATTSNIT